MFDAGFLSTLFLSVVTAEWVLRKFSYLKQVGERVLAEPHFPSILLILILILLLLILLVLVLVLVLNLRS